MRQTGPPQPQPDSGLFTVALIIIAIVMIAFFFIRTAPALKIKPPKPSKQDTRISGAGCEGLEKVESKAKIVFTAAVYKVQTLVDGGLRLTLDLPETDIPQAAMLMECKREGIPLRFTAKVETV